MATTNTIRVELAERSYDIEIGEGNLADVVAFVQARRPTSHVVVISDTNVDPLYADKLADRFTDEQHEAHVFVVDAGEASKAPEVAQELWETMLGEGVDRQSTVIAVGGGVVGDLAGFVAATFARGLPFFQVPTSLLAQVDSSVGGKVGVNLPGGKNMVGAFWQPQGVLIDVQVLKTLPDREYRAGLAEVVKYGVIMDAEFFAFLESNVEAINTRQPTVLKQIIARSCQLKAEVVQADEREQATADHKLSRAILNYGHTFCHAIEAATGYQGVLHGEGVAMGMVCASRLAERLARIDQADTARQVALLKALHLPTECPQDLDAEKLLQFMWRDKKVQDGDIKFVLPTRIGEVGIVGNVAADDILPAIRPDA